MEGITKLSDNAAKALAAHKQGLKLTALETVGNVLISELTEILTIAIDVNQCHVRKALSSPHEGIKPRS